MKTSLFFLLLILLFAAPAPRTYALGFISEPCPDATAVRGREAVTIRLSGLPQFYQYVNKVQNLVSQQGQALMGQLGRIIYAVLVKVQVIAGKALVPPAGQTPEPQPAVCQKVNCPRPPAVPVKSSAS